MTLLFLWNLHVSNLLSLVATLGMACVWVPFCLWSGRRSYLKANQQRPDMLGLQTLDLTAEGVRQTTVNTETVMKWAIFSEVLETPQQILFFISRRHAIVVPKHAFSSQAEVASFFEAARAYKSGEAVVTAELPNVWPPPAPDYGIKQVL